MDHPVLISPNYGHGDLCVCVRVCVRACLCVCVIIAIMSYMVVIVYVRVL